jgi:thiol oxidase
MNSIKKIFKLIVLELILFEVICSQLSAEVSLYDENDSVIVLNADNFGHYVYDQNAFILVNFYIHWCGHCVAFSPIWKQFAYDIRNWKSMVRVAAINCAEDQNNDLCERYGTNSFPRVRIFPMNALRDDFGQKFEFHNQSVVSIRAALVDFLLKSQKTYSNRLNIFPISVASRAQLFNVLPIHLGKHNLIFLERKPTNLGVEVFYHFCSSS